MLSKQWLEITYLNKGPCRQSKAVIITGFGYIWKAMFSQTLKIKKQIIYDTLVALWRLFMIRWS